MKVNDLLLGALELLDKADEETSAVWPRGAAVLIREAIEGTLDHYWSATVKGMAGANRAEQWIALPTYVSDPGLVYAAHHAWSELSTACHQRGYDVGLTEAELRAHARAANALAVLVRDELSVPA